MKYVECTDTSIQNPINDTIIDKEFSRDKKLHIYCKRIKDQYDNLGIKFNKIYESLTELTDMILKKINLISAMMEYQIMKLMM